MLKRVFVVLALALGALFLDAGNAAGCGDKFVLVGPGTRVLRSRFPSTILIFMNPSSRVPLAESEFRLEATLKAAGHRPVLANSEAEVEKALASGKFDLVLADVADAPGLRKQAATVASPPAVLALLYKPSPAELSAAEKEAQCMVRPSRQSRDLLAVVDTTMKDRSKGLAANCEIVE